MVMARRIAGGNNRTAVPTSSTCDPEPRTAGMIIASQASIRACAAVIGPPWSSSAAPSFPRSASRSMVTVTWGSFSALGGREPDIQEPAEYLDEGLAAADLRRTRIRGAVDGGAGCGEPVDGLGHDLHPE